MVWYHHHHATYTRDIWLFFVVLILLFLAMTDTTSSATPPSAMTDLLDLEATEDVTGEGLPPIADLLDLTEPTDTNVSSPPPVQENGIAELETDKDETNDNASENNIASVENETSVNLNGNDIVENAKPTPLSVAPPETAAPSNNEGDSAAPVPATIEAASTLNIPEPIATPVETSSPNETSTPEATPSMEVKEKPHVNSSTGPPVHRNNNETQLLRDQLAALQVELEGLRSQRDNDKNDSARLLEELQGQLQQHMTARAEAEDQARRTHAAMEQMKQAQSLQQTQQMDQTTQELQQATQQRDQLQEQVEAMQQVISGLESQVEKLEEDRRNQEEELKVIREQRHEQERREIALTNRLNAAKKKEADKANLAEHFEDEMKALREDAEDAKKQAQELSEAKEALEEELAQLKTRSEARIRHAELALADEKKLNEDRKSKMKAFIEKKSEELRQAKVDAESMQSELTQTSKSLMDLNTRWKQLHAQWVQSQTRNRELQRDLNRIKKDSENLHKVGDTLEMKLSRSATETEEHKNKRLAAKNELMTVLKTLEGEREVSARLRDAIKFTFTPKALSQQQLLRENIDELENELNRLSRRFGKPLPPLSNGLDASERSEFNDVSIQEGSSSGEDGIASRVDMDIQRLIAKLDNETQGVSQQIVALSGEIERLHVLIDVSGSRTCYSALSEIILGASQSNTSTNDGHGGMAESTVPLRAIRSHQYGQVPSNAGN